MATKVMSGSQDAMRAAIIDILSEHPGIEARKIASILRSRGWAGLRRKEVNSALYRGLSSRQFRKDGSTAPRWWLGKVATRPESNRPSNAEMGLSGSSWNHRMSSTGPVESGSGEQSGDWRIVELD